MESNSAVEVKFTEALRNYLIQERMVKAAYVEGRVDGYQLADFFDASRSVRRAISRAR